MKQWDGNSLASMKEAGSIFFTVPGTRRPGRTEVLRGRCPGEGALGSVRHRCPAQPGAASLGLQLPAVDTFPAPSDVSKQPRRELGMAPCFRRTKEETEAQTGGLCRATRNVRGGAGE